MKKLTIKIPGKAPQPNEVNEIQDLVKKELANSFLEFLLIYSDTRIEENRFVFEGTTYIINDVLSIIEIKELFNDILAEYKRKLIPFAMDPGGWHFCLSFDADTYGKIIINRWTDHLPEEQFIVIADSFEEFINGLKRGDEV